MGRKGKGHEEGKRREEKKDMIEKEKEGKKRIRYERKGKERRLGRKGKGKNREHWVTKGRVPSPPFYPHSIPNRCP